MCVCVIVYCVCGHVIRYVQINSSETRGLKGRRSSSQPPNFSGYGALETIMFYTTACFLSFFCDVTLGMFKFFL